MSKNAMEAECPAARDSNPNPPTSEPSSLGVWPGSGRPMPSWWSDTRGIGRPLPGQTPDRKSTRLNSSHGYISYAVFCLKKKKIKLHLQPYHRDSLTHN